jgi:protocatechuate 3,4-dioxygenase beta subunit
LTCGLAAISAAQGVGQSSRPTLNSTLEDARSGVVMGVAVDALTDRPIPSALVTLGGTAVVADGYGRFAFTELTHGRYHIRASKPGYFEGAYGRLRPSGPERELDLAADERIGDLKIALWRFSTIGGAVTDEYGEPMAGIRVEVISRLLRAGTRVLVRAGDTRTDDRGSYRLEGLAAGEHLVVALPFGLPPTQTGIFAYPVQYAPGVPMFTQAAPIVLAVGDDRLGVDLRMRLTPALTVTGTTYDQTGNTVAATLTLASASSDASATPEFEAASATSGSDGRFSFNAVTPGAYTLRAVAEPPAAQTNPNVPIRLMWASVPLGLDALNIRGLDVMLRTAFRVSGRVDFENPSGRRLAVDARKLSGVLEPVAGQMSALSRSVTFAIGGSGTFITGDVLPGRYVFRVDGLPEGWSVKHISMSGRDLTNAPVTIDRDVPYLTVLLTDNPPELAGVVRRSERAEPAATVIMFPAGTDSWTDAAATGIGVRSVRAGRDGSYRLTGLPPGEYYVLAVEDDVTNGWKDERTFAEMARVATHVSITGSEKRTLDLKLVVVSR